MSLFSWLTGSGDSANKVVDKGLSIIDAAFHTDQEKAEGKQKTLDWFLKYQEATRPQNVARRIIAFQVTSMWMFLILLGVVAKYFEGSESEALDDGTTPFSEYVFTTLSENVNSPFSIIIAFYFLAHVVRGLKNGK